MPTMRIMGFELTGTAAVIISVVAFLATQLSSKRKDTNTVFEQRIEWLSTRLEACELDRKQLHDRCDTLQRENLHLMRNILALDKLVVETVNSAQS